jgi:hypothetical protein
MTHEVHIQATHYGALLRLLREADNEMGRILDVNFKIPLPRKDSAYPLNLTKDPTQIINFMAQFQQHTPAKHSTSRDCISIIYIGTPSWKVLPNL